MDNTEITIPEQKITISTNIKRTVYWFFWGTMVGGFMAYKQTFPDDPNKNPTIIGVLVFLTSMAIIAVVTGILLIVWERRTKFEEQLEAQDKNIPTK